MKQSRILLADSHQVMLEGMRYLLEPFYEIVGMVDNVDLLLKSAVSLKPDIVVADLSVAISHQSNTVARLKKQNPKVKIIILSIYDEVGVMKQALDAGALGFVLLRTIAWDLIPAVQSVLQGRTFVSRAVYWN